MHDRKTHDRQWLGREGEDRAARFLESRGYRIVARNVRVDRVEIDLIVRRGGLLVFVEVKSRRSTGSIARSSRRPPPGSPSGPGFDPATDPPIDSPIGHGHAAEAVDSRKQGRLRRGAHAWLASNPGVARRTERRRFDVVTCLFEATAHGTGASQPPRNETTAPEGARWSIEHWEAAF